MSFRGAADMWRIGCELITEVGGSVILGELLLLMKG